jgi:hypothetical protein
MVNVFLCALTCHVIFGRFGGLGSDTGGEGVAQIVLFCYFIKGRL